ncbi:putative glycoside hydrolase family 5 protein [Zalerion maritima]|uniref:cellulase n=1 Tax=Zalerion maritima TaxID=339359 RepID=A0AAD5WNA4_9PEZI|nr:putative glycoside hydrolase family 5 protein [Zalerion maritima]
MKAALAAAAFATGALAQQGAYGQCGGINWTGQTTCVSGYTCTYLNDWYSQCVPGSQTTTAGRSSTKTKKACSKTRSSGASTIASATAIEPPSFTTLTTASPSAFTTSLTFDSTTLTSETISSTNTALASSETSLASSSSATSALTSVTPAATASTSSNTLTSATSTTSSSTLITSSTSSSSSSEPTGGTGTGSFKWFGADESCAEFGENTYPGTYGTHFIFPDTSAIQTLMNEGMNTFRISFLMERMAVGSITASLDADYLANLTTVVDYITSAGGWAVLDPHNYGRYDGSIITSTSDFGAFWTKMATAFVSYDQVIFDTNNEYHGLDQDLVLDLNQAAIDAIRAAGATSQYIFVEGNAWSGAWSWNTTNTNLVDLTDPQGKIVYEMHQYLDSDSSGTSESCVSGSVGVQRVVGATEWLKQNGKVGIIGEFAGGPNSVCMEAVTGLLDHLLENSDVWMGALWWAGGPWWGDYMYSFEPPSGTGYSYYHDTLATYA